MVIVRNGHLGNLGNPTRISGDGMGDFFFFGALQKDGELQAVLVV